MKASLYNWLGSAHSTIPTMRSLPDQRHQFYRNNFNEPCLFSRKCSQFTRQHGKHHTACMKLGSIKLTVAIDSRTSFIEFSSDLASSQTLLDTTCFDLLDTGLILTGLKYQNTFCLSSYAGPSFPPSHCTAGLNSTSPKPGSSPLFTSKEVDATVYVKRRLLSSSLRSSGSRDSTGSWAVLCQGRGLSYVRTYVDAQALAFQLSLPECDRCERPTAQLRSARLQTTNAHWRIRDRVWRHQRKRCYHVLAMAEQRRRGPWLPSPWL